MNAVSNSVFVIMALCILVLQVNEEVMGKQWISDLHKEAELGSSILDSVSGDNDYRTHSRSTDQM
jgi:hypothetical protein